MTVEHFGADFIETRALLAAMQEDESSCIREILKLLPNERIALMNAAQKVADHCWDLRREAVKE